MLFLIGMPGVGKTYWGEKIAEYYHLSFIDLDNYIESIAGQSINDIFEQKGEAAFRELEASALRDVICNKANKPAIIACGGGTPKYHDNMRLLKEEGIVVYLKADIETLLENLSKKGHEHQLLKDAADKHAKLDDLYTQRHAIYEKAHHIISSENISVSNFEEIIRSCIERQ